MMQAFNHLLFVNMNINDLFKTVVHESMFIDKMYLLVCAAW
jgi:hypothetical protein